MHTYRKSEPNLWTVGYYVIVGFTESSSEHQWQPAKDFPTEEEAAAYVNYLNGGNGHRKAF